MRATIVHCGLLCLHVQYMYSAQVDVVIACFLMLGALAVADNDKLRRSEACPQVNKPMAMRLNRISALL